MGEHFGDKIKTIFMEIITGIKIETYFGVRLMGVKVAVGLVSSCCKVADRYSWLRGGEVEFVGQRKRL